MQLSTALFQHRNCPACDTNHATWLAGELLLYKLWLTCVIFFMHVMHKFLVHVQVSWASRRRWRDDFDVKTTTLTPSSSWRHNDINVLATTTTSTMPMRPWRRNVIGVMRTWRSWQRRRRRRNVFTTLLLLTSSLSRDNDAVMTSCCRQRRYHDTHVVMTMRMLFDIVGVIDVNVTTS